MGTALVNNAKAIALFFSPRLGTVHDLSVA